MTNVCIGLTGATGFVGKHLAAQLNAREATQVQDISRADFARSATLANRVGSCDAIVHLAAMNRGDEHELYETNVALVGKLCQAIVDSGRTVPVVLASSTLRQADSAYGRSKRDGEALLTESAARHGFPATIAVIPNVFGPGCRPFYNSVVATFCHQLIQGEMPRVIEDRALDLIFVSDLASQLIDLATCPAPAGPGSPRVVLLRGQGVLRVSELLQKLTAWRDHYFGDGVIPQFPCDLDRKLYATFLSHVPPNQHQHVPQVHRDDRGSLFEVIRTKGGGQVFFSTTKPGVVRGNHFHTRKIEWFCVVQGEATIRMRQIGSDAVHEFRVSGRQPQFISIPAFHTHHIENSGSEELLTMFWCSELFEQADPDTYFEKVA